MLVFGLAAYAAVATGVVALCAIAAQSDREAQVTERFRLDYGPSAVMSEQEYQELMGIDAERIYVRRTWHPSLN
jgi:hypothetical protein